MQMKTAMRNEFADIGHNSLTANEGNKQAKGRVKEVLGSTNYTSQQHNRSFTNWSIFQTVILYVRVSQRRQTVTVHLLISETIYIQNDAASVLNPNFHLSLRSCA